VALVALGGAVGTAVRYGLSGRFERGAGAFPLATFGENVVGAALLGLLVAVLVSGRSTAGWARPLLATGALGAFTTFSTFATELTLLGRDGRVGLAVAYAGATLAAGLVAGRGGRPVIAVAVALAGAAGAAARYLVDTAVSRSSSGRFPLGTLVVNVVGSAAAGALAGVAARHGVDDVARTVVATGFLGAFTTFSTFAVDTVGLAEEASPPAAALNVAANLVLTVGFAAAGYLLAVTL
jgi:CrcB protein